MWMSIWKQDMGHQGIPEVGYAPRKLGGKERLP